MGTTGHAFLFLLTTTKKESNMATKKVATKAPAATKKATPKKVAKKTEVAPEPEVATEVETNDKQNSNGDGAAQQERQFVGDVSQLKKASVVKFAIDRGYGFFSVSEEQADTLYFHIKQFRRPIFTGSNIILGDQEIPQAELLQQIKPGVHVLYETRMHPDKGLYASPWTLESLVQKIKEDEVDKAIFRLTADWKVVATVADNNTKEFVDKIVDGGKQLLGSFTDNVDAKFAIKMFMRKKTDAVIKYSWEKFNEETCEFEPCERPF